MNELVWRRQPKPDFTEVAERHLDSVFRYVLLLTGDRALAEDLTAEAFEKALRSWRRYDPRRGGPAAWLCAIARTTALDHFRAEERRRRREERFALENLELVTEPLDPSFSPELDDALRSLSAGEREVLALRIVLDLDGDAAARVLGITPTACSTRLSRALHKLEERMESHVVT